MSCSLPGYEYDRCITPRTAIMERKTVRGVRDCCTVESEVWTKLAPEESIEMQGQELALAIDFQRGDRMEIINAFDIGRSSKLLKVKHLSNGRIGYIPRIHVVIDYTGPGTNLGQHQFGTCSSNDDASSGTAVSSLDSLPLELLDMILQQSYLMCALNENCEQNRPSGKDFLSALLSVDYCWLQRITRRKFKRSIKRLLSIFYRKTKVLPAIIRKTRRYLERNIQPCDKFVHLLWSLNCLTDSDSVSILKECRSIERNSTILQLMRFFDENRFSIFKKCLRQTKQADIARLLGCGGVYSISNSFTTSLNVIKTEYVRGVTKLRNAIYVLCRSHHAQSSDSNSIVVFENHKPFRRLQRIEITQIKDPKDIGSSDHENCLYVTDSDSDCVWKISGETGCEITTWLTNIGDPHKLSKSNDGHLLMIRRNQSPSSLLVYGPEAVPRLTFQLPDDILKPRHAVQTQTGSFIILHMWANYKLWKTSNERANTWAVSELQQEGQMVVIRSFTGENMSQRLSGPWYLSINSDSDRIFVADTGKKRVIELDSNLNWRGILSHSQTHRPLRLYYDEEEKQLIVGGVVKEGGVDIYTSHRKLVDTADDQFEITRWCS